eukprot:2167767-Amphidinium_carterae.4
MRRCSRAHTRSLRQVEHRCHTSHASGTTSSPFACATQLVKVASRYHSIRAYIMLTCFYFGFFTLSCVHWTAEGRLKKPSSSLPTRGPSRGHGLQRCKWYTQKIARPSSAIASMREGCKLLHG